MDPISFNIKEADKKNTNNQNKKTSFPPKPPQPELLPYHFGRKSGEDIQSKFDELEKTMTKRFHEYQKQNCDDLTLALKVDLKTLANYRNQGSQDDKITLYNQLSHEFYLQEKYQVNLTQNGMSWSQDDLKQLDKQLASLPEKFTTFNPHLHEMRLENIPGNAIGKNDQEKQVILLEPGRMREAVIHEVGHHFDNENPQWKEFLKISGWQDVTHEFANIDNKYQNKATFKKDGKVYQDGQKIDLNGDGKSDGIVKVHYKQVMIHSEKAKFITPYASAHPLEDFAETFEHFFLETKPGHTKSKELKRKCPEKFQFMIHFMGGSKI